MQNNLKKFMIYEIFVRNYSNAGTFNEVINDLSRIKKLGADVLWLMPISHIGIKGRKGNYGSPYSIKNYKSINESYGNEKQFSLLCEKAKELELIPMIDIVFNHTSLDSDLLEEHPNWFLKNNEKINRKVDDWSDIYDLDFSNKELWEYLINVLKYWIDLGVEGFRCDVASLIPIEFWIKARKTIDEYSDKKIIWLAESVHKRFTKILRDKGFVCHSDVELHSVFDITYDYDGFEYLENYFKGKNSLDDYINHLLVQETLYPKDSLKLRFLENHDCDRIANIIEDKNRLKNWTLFFNLIPGVPLIYMGQEVMLKKLPDLFDKDTIRWNDGDFEFFHFIKNIIKFTKEIKENCNIFNIEKITQGVYLLKWEGEFEKYYSIINLENKYGKINIERKLNGVDLISGKIIEFNNNMEISKTPIIIRISKQ